MSTPTIVDDLTVTTYTKRHGQWFARVTGPEYLTGKLARQRGAKAIRAAKVAAGEYLEPSYRVATRVVSERAEWINREFLGHSYLVTEV